jgi:hypothetical protein
VFTHSTLIGIVQKPPFRRSLFFTKTTNRIMHITMQGDWTVRVKSKSAAFPQRFVIVGADSGNGTYNGLTTTAPVEVQGATWSIFIQHDPGGGIGFRNSTTRLKSPQRIGDNHVFDIESDDRGAGDGDGDFNDLVLTCTTPFDPSDYLVYGHLSLTSGICAFNPCYRDWMVIDTPEALREAFLKPDVAAILRKYYRKRFPKWRLPFPPIPPEPWLDELRRDWRGPIMINLKNDFQIPPRQADVYQFSTKNVDVSSKSAKMAAGKGEITTYRLDRSITDNVSMVASPALAERLQLAEVVDVGIRYRCSSEPGAFVTLTFEEYDRTAAELAGGAYTGEGHRQALGTTTTDAFGNYLFRFSRTWVDNLIENWLDVADGESTSVQVRPDVIVKVVSLAPYELVYESAAHFNIRNLKRINLCIPGRRVRATSFCFNGSLIGGLGNVFIGGNPNTLGSRDSIGIDSPLIRNGYANLLDAKGIVTVNNSQAGFTAKCAAWAGTIDVKGCMYNARRGATDPLITSYTIRYTKSPTANDWQYVTESYLHPKYSKRNEPNYHGDLVGPEKRNLKVDGGAAQSVSSYRCIQTEALTGAVDWEFTNIDRYMQLNSALYEGDQSGTVYFRVDGYDAAGNQVATDLIALYISNRKLDFSLSEMEFADSSIEELGCGLFRVLDGSPASEGSSQMATPITVEFQVHDQDPLGFIDAYELSLTKCPSNIAVRVNGNPVSGNVLANQLPPSSDVCAYSKGTPFNTLVSLSITPESGGTWLNDGEEYGALTAHLWAVRRVTNGYNSGEDRSYRTSTSIGILRK